MKARFRAALARASTRAWRRFESDFPAGQDQTLPRPGFPWRAVAGTAATGRCQAGTICPFSIWKFSVGEQPIEGVISRLTATGAGSVLAVENSHTA